MSIDEVLPFITKDYGLKDEDLNEIAERENLRDISRKFSSGIDNTLHEFGTKQRIRILEFGENSGSTTKDRISFASLVHAEKNIFYSHLYSNKDCCVFFLYSGHKIKDEELFNCRVIPHEFAHHYQFTEANFPCLLPHGVPHVYRPQFALVHEIGPKIGEIYVGNLLLKDGLLSFFKDFSERISDFVCEGILIEKGFTEGLLEEYREIAKNDLTKVISMSDPNYRAAIRYVRKLALRDEAEWQSLIHSIFAGKLDSLQGELMYNMKRVLKLNGDYAGRKRAFREIYNISTEMNYESFREASVAVDYIKQISSLLNIEIRTKENW